ncbi:hypothetical protein MUP46_03020 [Patescibacteria group bacterium]|nr:hypothetical protein [Patescibacteria group bacterium]
MDPKNKTGVGFYLDSDHHRKIRKWCDETGIDFFVFCRVAVQHLFFYLTILPGDGPRDMKEFLKRITSNKK